MKTKSKSKLFRQTQNNINVQNVTERRTSFKQNKKK